MESEGVKVALAGPDGEIETLWARDRGNDEYELDNLPWFAYRLSLGDVVAATPDENGQLVFQHVVRKSGNRTVRVMLEHTDTGDELTFESRKVLNDLNGVGCDYEGMGRILFAVNVPPRVDLRTVSDILIESGFQWEYADPTYDDIHATRTETATPDA